MKYPITIAAACCVSACAPTVQRADGDGVRLAENFANADTSKDAPSAEIAPYGFSAEGLHQLFTLARANNPNILAAIARHSQADATARKVGAALAPSLIANAGRSETLSDGDHSGRFSLGALLRYTPDINGKLKAERNAAALSADAASYDITDSYAVLYDAIATAYITALTADAEYRLLQEQITTSKRILELKQTRLSYGSGDGLALLQQQAANTQLQSEIPDIRAAFDAQRQRLTALTGTPATELPILKGTALPELPAVPAAGFPSRLLTERPDIKAAMARLRAADASVGAAKSDRFPSFTLSANGALNAAALGDVLDDFLLTLAADAAAPLADGGERKAEIARQEALADERLQAYRQAVILAVEETENALNRRHENEQKLIALRNQREAFRLTYKQAVLSYESGDTGYVDVLDSLRNVQQTERAIIRAMRDTLLQQQALYTALAIYPRRAAE